MASDWRRDIPALRVNAEQRDRDRLEERRKTGGWDDGPRGCCIFPFIIFLIWGSVNVSRRWIPEEDDLAKKTWVSGDCLVIDRKIIGYHPDKKQKKNTYFQVKIFVDRLNRHVGASKMNVSLDVEPAYNYPHISRESNVRDNWDVHATWFSSKGDANHFKKKYPVGDVVQCFWDQGKTKRISVTNDGGDWTWVRVGCWMLGFAALALFILILPLEACVCSSSPGPNTTSSGSAQRRSARPPTEVRAHETFFTCVGPHGVGARRAPSEDSPRDPGPGYHEQVLGHKIVGAGREQYLEVADWKGSEAFFPLWNPDGRGLGVGERLFEPVLGSATLYKCVCQIRVGPRKFANERTRLPFEGPSPLQLLKTTSVEHAWPASEYPDGMMYIRVADWEGNGCAFFPIKHPESGEPLFEEITIARTAPNDVAESGFDDAPKCVDVQLCLGGSIETL